MLNGGGFATQIAYADVSASFDGVFLADGPVRTGVVRGTYTPSPFLGLGGEVFYGASFPGLINAYTHGFGPGAPTMYITLGRPYPVSLFFNLDTSGGNDEAPSPAMSDLLSLSFFEADGVTPVNIAEIAVPEPGNCALASLAFAALALTRKRRSRGDAVAPAWRGSARS